jgi:hypothetical protein
MVTYPRGPLEPFVVQSGRHLKTGAVGVDANSS